MDGKHGPRQDGMAEARPDAVMHRHRSAWRLEHASWALMALLLVAALLGVFGGGPLSHARTGSAGTVELEYDRLLRAAAPTEYRLEIQPGFAADGRLEVRIDQDLVDAMEIASIVPEPESVTAGPGYTRFSFRIEAGGRSPARVVIGFEPATFGRFSGALSVDDAAPLTVSHFVFP